MGRNGQSIATVMWAGLFLLQICALCHSFPAGQTETDPGPAIEELFTTTTTTTTPKPPCILSPEQGELFSSDNFPSNYNENTNCNYTMDAGPGNKIKLTFFMIETETHPNCRYDPISIYESDGNDTLISKLCGKSSKQHTVFSSGPSVILQFKSDGTSTMMGWLAVWSVVPVDEAEADPEHGEYVVTLPGTLLEENPEELCVELFPEEVGGVGGTTTHANVNVALLIKTSSGGEFKNLEPAFEESFKIEAGDSKRCVNITLKEGQTESESKGIIHLTIKDDKNYNVNEYRSVHLLKKEKYSLIQTDKGKYKPKDDVKFRILLVDSDLLASKITILDEVWLEDVQGRRIVQWKQVPLQNGLVQKEFNLDEEPTLGTWTIFFQAGKIKESANFEVTEYILPKFQVDVKGPDAVLKDAKELKWEVCGKYTHGGSVKGSAEANFNSLFQHRTWRPPPPIKKNILKTGQVSQADDCISFTLSREEIKNLTEKVSEFHLDVKFIEDGTGAAEEGKWSGSLVDKPFEINFGDSSTNFILGGFPYSGEVKVVNYDSSGRVGEQLELCVRLFRDVENVRNFFNRNPGVWNMDEDNFVSAGALIANLTFAEKCHEVETDSSGSYKFSLPLPPLQEDVVKLSIRVKAINVKEDEESGIKQPVEKLDVSLKHVDANLTMSIASKDKSVLQCGSRNNPKVFLSGIRESSITLHFYAMTQGAVISSEKLTVPLTGEDQTSALVGDRNELSLGELNSESNSDKVVKMIEIPLDVDYRSVPKLKLLVVVVVGNETLTDSHVFNVEPCLRHSVSAQWSADKVNPGTYVTLDVKADIGSLCGLSATDKSVELLGNKNKITKAKVSDLTERIKERKTQNSEKYWSYQSKCPQAYAILQEFEYPGITLITNLPFLETCQTLTDATKEPEPVFEGYYHGMRGDSMPQPVPLSLAVPDSRPILGRSKMRTSMVHSANYKIKAPVVKLRSYFPETWLFSLEPVSEGNLISNLSAPHTITSWEAEAVCMSPYSGLGVAAPAKLTVSQDFFADLRLPYSVKRGESFPLNISLFNSLDRQLPLIVTIQDSELEYTEKSWSLCLEPRGSEVVTTPATARNLGDLNITVRAEIQNMKDCDSVEQGLGYQDNLVKPIRVKAEGIPVEKVESEFKCVEEGADNKVRLEKLVLPENVVEGSDRAWVYVTGDIMAPALENVGNLVSMPTGCGEQNMVGLVPNIYLLQYLKSNNKVEPDLESKAKSYMEVGYNRQQKYRHPDGAYSIWGPGDKDGSTWLTAFVVKSFSEASEFIQISKSQVEESVQWLLTSRNKTGCFLKRGYVYSSSLQGGGKDESLTAFVTIALLEASSKMEIPIDAKIITEALSCVISSQNETDLYSLTVTAYAANLLKYKLSEKELDSNPAYDPELDAKIDNMMALIDQAANTSVPGAKFWDQPSVTNSRWWSYSRSKAVEMTAYNVMSLVLQDKLEEAVASVKWLARQRNSQGGFVSTQDTVVALQALSMYARSVNQDVTDLDIQLKEVSDTERDLQGVKVEEENLLVLQTQKLTTLPAKIEMGIQGQGCALVQTVLRYNLPEVTSNQGFTLRTGKSGERESHLEVCAAYTGDRDATDMVVIQVEMVTGWEAYSPDYLLNEIDSGVKRVEEDKKENMVILYFDNIPKQEKCVLLEMKNVMAIENAKPARVVVYDYYNTEDRTELMYTLS